MVRIIYKFDVEYPNYLLQAIVKDDKEEIDYKTLTKCIDFNEFSKNMKYTTEQMNKKIELDNMMKEVMGETIADLFKEELVNELEAVLKMESALEKLSKNK
jgi:hypothetical protein